MAEYIEREALRQEIERIYQKHFAKSKEKFVQDTFKAMFKRIDNAPAADVAPVVHGDWGKPFKVDAHNNGYKCSECGYYGVPCWHYCPKCGARMDGE